MPRLLIAASGTGGHLFPALSVADALPEPWSVRWVGVPDRLETSLVPERYPLTTVKAGGLQGRGLRKLIQLIQLLAASGGIRRLIQRERIDAVFTTGGYIAAPAILAARWCGIPVVLHESNAIPGRVTRLLGRFCTRVAVGLEAAAPRIPGCRAVVTGTPVRAAFLQQHALPTWVPPGNGPLLVVIGGSQGALGLNRMTRVIFPSLLNSGCRVVHLTGSNDPDVGCISHPLLVERPFSDEIPALLQHADLAISRAGAGSLSELAVSGTPTVLVPFPQAADRHQDANAVCAAAVAAAVIVHQHDPSETTLRDTVWRLLGSRLQGGDSGANPLPEMGQAMRDLGVEDADQKLVTLLEDLVAEAR